ncbi:MAG: hypothetical protein KAJ46_02875 [Sedimentisphaerales bacterium]|nr:hypothetical protein [Sedimentisphaerales bacterium]
MYQGEFVLSISPEGLFLQPNVKNKCVVIIIGHTRNFADNRWLCISPRLRKGFFGIVRSYNGMTGSEYQVYQTKQNEDNHELWQIFTLPVKPGRYRFNSALVIGSSVLSPRKTFGDYWVASSSEFDAKAGEYIYIGMMNVDTASKRKGIGKFLFGSVSSIKNSWDSSSEHIDFIRQKIPELKNVEIVHQPINVEFL